MSFAKKMLNVHLTGTFASVFSDCFIRGINGCYSSLDFTDSVLSGAKMGVTFVAFPIAEEILSRVSERYNKRRQNADKRAVDKAIYYTATSAFAAVITTVVSTPLVAVQLRHRGDNKTSPFKGAVNECFFEFLTTIGTVSALDYIESTTEIPKNSIASFARRLYCSAIGDFGACMIHIPFQYALFSVPMIDVIDVFLDGVVPNFVTSEAQNYMLRTIC